MHEHAGPYGIAEFSGQILLEELFDMPGLNYFERGLQILD
jgi:hypothetical protein